MTLRILVVDDSALFRRAVMDTLSPLPDVEVVGWAGNGRTALERIAALAPDLITLDIEMPGMGGIELLQALKGRPDRPGVIVLSALSVRGGDLTMKALELGAFDFITKPAGDGRDTGLRTLRESLVPLVRAYARRLEIRNILAGKEPPSPSPSPAPFPGTESPRVVLSTGPPDRKVPRDMVLVGVSTGGPNALQAVLPGLPPDLGVPVLVVQHMPPLFTASLAASLAGKCALRVKEAQDGEGAASGTVFIAPGGRHMKVVPGPGGERILRVTDDAPENNCRPAVDYLFRSASHHYPGRAVAVIMTGMGNDGTLGLRLLKRGGCTSIAQDEESCVVFGMPKAAIDAGVVDTVVPLGRLAEEIVRAVRGSRP